MKKIVIFSALAAVAVVASAQEQGRVLSATPIIQQVGVPQQVCGNETVYNGNRTTGAGAVIGAIAGGAVGNTIGKGSGRAAATAIGVLGGAVVGNQIEGNGQPQYQNVQRCSTETYYENRTVGYNVVYEYAGRQYTTPHPERPRPLDPGERAARWPDLFHTTRPVCGPGCLQPTGCGDLHLPRAAGVPGAPHLCDAPGDGD